MKKQNKHVIIQYNSIKEFIVICKDVDIHYCMEICDYLNRLHTGLRYTFFENNYFKANENNLLEIL